MVFPTLHTLHFTFFITSLTLFLKILGLQGKVPKASAGSLFQTPEIWAYTFHHYRLQGLRLITRSVLKHEASMRIMNNLSLFFIFIFILFIYFFFFT
jgi:TRAP-type uncharacterized transport system fused permease subunit